MFAQITNEICFLRLVQWPQLRETQRWLDNLHRMPEICPYWQSEPTIQQLISEPAVAKIYMAILDRRKFLKVLAEKLQLDFTEMTRDLFPVSPKPFADKFYTSV